jgi:sulfite reductase (ferredoxin)
VFELLAKLGLGDEPITMRMSGCPNGCARPYIADIGIVGRSGDQYTIYLGGNMEGTRLNTLYRDLVRGDDLPAAIRSVLAHFVASRRPGERLGDWADRLGIDAIVAATVVAAN